MEHTLGEKTLASGDASKPSSDLLVTDSLLNLLPEPVLEKSLLPQILEDDPPAAPQSPKCDIRRTSKHEKSVPQHHWTNGSDQGNINLIRSASVGRSLSNSCLVHAPTVRLVEVSRLLYCSDCLTLPMTALTVHTCNMGHQVCGHCFGNGHRICVECKSPLEGRNELLENFLQRLRQVCPDIFPQLESSTQQKEDKAESSLKTVQHSSHRPVDCPHLTCYRVVASNGFVAHFQFEHHSVPVIKMSLELPQKFKLPERCTRDILPRAIAVLEVYIAGYEAAQRDSYSRTPVFPVRRDVVVCVLLTSTVQIKDSSFLVAWCSCLYEEEQPLTYRLLARTSNGGEACYNGPMKSLHHSQKPLHVLKDAQCLVLAPGSFNKIAFLEIEFNIAVG